MTTTTEITESHPEPVDETSATKEEKSKDVKTAPKEKNNIHSCLYHSQKCRSVFQQFLNVVRNSMSTVTVIPNRYLNKVGGLVCTCQRLHFHTDIDEILEEEDIQNIKSDVRNTLKKLQLGNIWSIIGKLLFTKLTDNMDQKQFDLGCNRLMYIIMMAICKHKCSYEFLDYKRHPKLQTGDQTTTVSSPDELQYQHKFKVDFPCNYISFVFGTNGNNIKQFAKSHKCALKVLDNTRGISIYNKQSVMFKLTCANVQKADKIERDLRNLMHTIKTKRETHLANVLKYSIKQRQRKASRAQARQRELQSIKGVTGFGGKTLKEDAKDNYSTKYQYMLKSKSSRKQEKVHPKHSALEDGNTWCVNCMLDYDKNIPNCEEACKYHKGYIAKRNGSFYWSCCNELPGKDTSRKGLAQSHKETGCTSDRHIWKPHKKASITKTQGNADDVKCAWHGIKHVAYSTKAKHVASLCPDS